MSIIRMQDKVPSVYVEESRDFQLMCRLFDCVFGAIKYNTDVVSRIINTDAIDSRLLSLLQTKLGFYSAKQFTDEELRYILKGFKDIIRDKGSLKAVKQALNIYKKYQGIDTGAQGSYIANTQTYSDSSDPYENDMRSYVITVGIEATYRDITLLDEILRYVLPAGYIIKYVFYDRLNINNDADRDKASTTVMSSDTPVVEKTDMEDKNNSSIRSNSTELEGVAKRILNAVDTTLIAEEMEGNVNE